MATESVETDSTASPGASTEYRDETSLEQIPSPYKKKVEALESAERQPIPYSSRDNNRVRYDRSLAAISRSVSGVDRTIQSKNPRSSRSLAPRCERVPSSASGPASPRCRPRGRPVQTC